MWHNLPCCYLSDSFAGLLTIIEQKFGSKKLNNMFKNNECLYRFCWLYPNTLQSKSKNHSSCITGYFLSCDQLKSLTTDVNCWQVGHNVILSVEPDEPDYDDGDDDDDLNALMTNSLRRHVHLTKCCLSVAKSRFRLPWFQSPTWRTLTAEAPCCIGSTRSPCRRWRTWSRCASRATRPRAFCSMGRASGATTSPWSCTVGGWTSTSTWVLLRLLLSLLCRP